MLFHIIQNHCTFFREGNSNGGGGGGDGGGGSGSGSGCGSGSGNGSGSGSGSGSNRKQWTLYMDKDTNQYTLFCRWSPEKSKAYLAGNQIMITALSNSYVGSS